MTVHNRLDIDYLIATARAAGEAILEVYRGDFDVDRKADTSPLTEADLRSHHVITGRLSQRYPEIPILSEENTEQAPYEVRRQWPAYWLVDPLDGTKEFIKRNGQFTVNIALVEESVPVTGVVYAPALDLLYYGSDGQGAFKVEASGEPLRLTRERSSDPGRLVIAGSLSHPSAEMDAFVAEQRRRYKQVDFIAMGSSLKICMVADGRADIYPRFGPTMEWDTAAAHAIVRAAGGRIVRHGTDQELRYNKENLLNSWFVVT